VLLPILASLIGMIRGKIGHARSGARA